MNDLDKHKMPYVMRFSFANLMMNSYEMDV